MGDLPNLYNGDEKAEILEKMQIIAKEEVRFQIKLIVLKVIATY